jgi:RNA polymerase sigma-70 factor (ECF subfamily)
MLGTLADAEDAVQETYLRLLRQDPTEIEDVEAWLVTVSGRVCLDMLRTDTVRKRYVGPWLPSPLVEPRGTDPDPADRITLDDSVRIGLLAAMERLSPAERVTLVLHDVFAFTFEQVAETTGRTPAACRKLASRARATIRSDTEPRFATSPQDARLVVERFASACATGNFDALVTVLDPDVLGEFDSGGRIPGAPQTPLVGAELVAVTLIHSLSGANAAFEVQSINAQPGIVVRLHQRVVSVITVETNGKSVNVIRAIGNPEKLAHLNRDVSPRTTVGRREDLK